MTLSSNRDPLELSKTHMSRFQSRSINILGVRVDDVSCEQVIEDILRDASAKKKAVLSYVNVHAVNLAFKTRWFKDFLNASDIVFCDGFGVKYAAGILYGRKIERFTPPDWLPDLIARGSKQGLTFFFLGSRPGVVEIAAKKMAELTPGFLPVGMDHGYLSKDQSSEENQALIQKINRSGADILVVGFGMPVQEKWILENRDNLGAAVILPVGAAFDYLAGEVVRVPRWMTDRGLEWFGRLIIEPGRLWKRYILGNPLFFSRVFLQKVGLLKINL
jgi:N-acetylglucosaminyldiphosphoundecaprenol N-acetyl-beta-D-mannosaminyltransferase